MLNSIKGTVIFTDTNYIILENNGLGYKIFTGILTLELKEGDEIFLWTYQVVRENALDLYGFKTFNELQFFELLISISGIGPKVALSILSVSSPQSLKHAIENNNTDELTKVSGIGKKNASKIIIELQNKVDKLNIKTKDSNYDLEVYETLEALGFSRNEIQEAVKNTTGTTTKEKIQQALKYFNQ